MKNPFKKEEQPKPIGIDAEAGMASEPPPLQLSDLKYLGISTKLNITYTPCPSEFDYHYKFNFMPEYRYDGYSYGTEGRAAVKKIGLNIPAPDGCRVNLEDDGSITLSYQHCPSLCELQAAMEQIDYNITSILQDFSRFQAFSSMKKKGA